MAKIDIARRRGIAQGTVARLEPSAFIH